MCDNAEMLDLMRKSYLRIPQRTQFATVIIPATATLFGIPLGDGKCIAVELQINTAELNSINGSPITEDTALIYYGDSLSQFYELTSVLVPRGTEIPFAVNRSKLIYCKDLSEIYVRGVGVATRVQVKILLGDEDVVVINSALQQAFG